MCLPLLCCCGRGGEGADAELILSKAACIARSVSALISCSIDLTGGGGGTGIGSENRFMYGVIKGS